MRLYRNQKTSRSFRPLRRSSAGGFTLVEVVTAIFITGLVFAGILAAYIQGARRAEWSGYSLAAQAVGLREIERAHSAVWDASSGAERNEITNLALMNFTVHPIASGGVPTVTGYTTNILDLPYSGSNFVIATNYVTIKRYDVLLNKVRVQFMRVDTVWPFSKGQAVKYFTNTIATYFAPDNRDPQL